MKPKHTPGPWTVKSNAKFMDFFSGEEKMFRIAFDKGSVHCSKPNARLIAAAPELLAVLEDAQEVLCEHGGHEIVELLERIDALVAKARGEA